MTHLRKSPARPRTSTRTPRYPRYVGLGAIALATACSGSAFVEGESETAGSGGSTPAGPSTTTFSTTATSGGGTGGVPGQAGAGQGGEAGSGNHGWGGGLDGFAPPPYGGGGVGGS